MIKKTLEKESYLPPLWALRVIHVERQFLTNPSDNNADDGYDDDNPLGEI